MRVDLSDETVARLKGLAEPLVDTFDSVIARLLDAYAPGIPSQPQGGPSELRDFSPIHPPDLKHTKVLSVSVDGAELPRVSANWNGLLNLAVALASMQTSDFDQLSAWLLVNFTIGRKEDEGYRYLAEINISVQGQDANSAWKAAFHVFRALNISATVVFAWRDKSDAAYPGTVGRFILKKN